MWSCDILTKHETAPAVMIHEQLHARSISHYGQKMYIQFSNIEESTVQLMTEEICRQNGIETIESDYIAVIYGGFFKKDRPVYWYTPDRL